MIGQPISRIDGPLKVTGGAVYSYEWQDAGTALYGAILGATIGRGRIIRMDTAQTERAPGVALVLTHRNGAAQAIRDGSLPDSFGRSWPVLVGDRIAFFGQPIAFVVASTFEQARAAAALVAVTYAAERGAYDLATHQDRAYAPKTANVGLATDSALGDLDRPMADAPVTLDQTYTTPHHFSQPLEPQACLARWDGDDLHVCVSTQIVAAARMSLAQTLQIPPERVHVDAMFVGGGFGSKLRVHKETILAALAARELKPSVKAAHTRLQVFNLTGHRPEMTHRIRLAATRDGRLTGVGHDVNMHGTKRALYVERTATVMRALYAAPTV